MRWTLCLLLISAGMLRAQDVAGADSSPEVSPSPSPVAAEATPAGTPTPETSPAAEPSPSPSPEATPVPESVSDLPTGDVGTLGTLEGAPLTTEDIIPMETEILPDSSFIDPNAIIPDEPPPPPAPVESQTEKMREQTIRYREVRVRAEQDPEIALMKEKAQQATTMEDRRAAFREYYRMLFKKIASIDKSLADKAKVMEEAYIRRLAQIRLEPTIPLNPPPTPEPLN